MHYLLLLVSTCFLLIRFPVSSNAFLCHQTLSCIIKCFHLSWSASLMIKYLPYLQELSLKVLYCIINQGFATWSSSMGSFPIIIHFPVSASTLLKCCGGWIILLSPFFNYTGWQHRMSKDQLLSTYKSIAKGLALHTKIMAAYREASLEAGLVRMFNKWGLDQK